VRGYVRRVCVPVLACACAFVSVHLSACASVCASVCV